MANEKRLIYSTDALEEASKAEFMGFRAEERKKNFLALISAILENCPTVDAVEVVRCKDCKWYQEGKIFAPIKFCFRLKHPKEDRKIGYNYAPDDFCSYGERRTDNGKKEERT